jgi:hypothetical protein
MWRNNTRDNINRIIFTNNTATKNIPETKNFIVVIFLIKTSDEFSFVASMVNKHKAPRQQGLTASYPFRDMTHNKSLNAGFSIVVSFCAMPSIAQRFRR